MTVAEERTRVAEVRAGVRRSGTVLSVVFFVLTAIAIAAATFFLHELATGIMCLVVAETLLHRSKPQMGVVAALWLGGLFSLIFALPHTGKPEGLLLFAAACAIAGVRVRNPLIGAFAPVFVIAYFAEINAYETALTTGVVVAAISLVLLAREWQRPSTELLFIMIILVAPIAGAAASWERASIAWSLAYIALAVAEVMFAVRTRHQAAFYGAAVSTTIAVIMLRDVLPLATEWKLIIAGALLFAVSVAISRALREKTSGFVMTPVKNLAEEAMRVLGTVALAPHATSPAPANSQPGGGGSFGGAGASGDF
ncbi:MAG TPA: hypothetical protein VF505_09115 [Thermoanaerobaculia bacterium]